MMVALSIAVPGCTSEAESNPGPPAPSAEFSTAADTVARTITRSSNLSGAETSVGEPLTPLDLPTAEPSGKGQRTLTATALVVDGCVVLKLADGTQRSAVFPPKTGVSYVPASGFGYIFLPGVEISPRLGDEATWTVEDLANPPKHPCLTAETPTLQVVDLASP